ncbi:hypothetical protein WISP_49452 [Willisornis vidua]|uniref:Uncharacterized protein n=1 Tax=Willisornis vidua TaxID=1566151 RepID=A0ABQ9DE15_9PASS|nr:hypothetical protein WISP_49452 [Willisornis vidua]
MPLESLSSGIPAVDPELQTGLNRNETTGLWLCHEKLEESAQKVKLQCLKQVLAIFSSWLKNGNFPDLQEPRMTELCAKIKGGSLGLSGANDVASPTVQKQQGLCVLAPFVWEESSSVFNSWLKIGNFPNPLMPRKD